MAYTLDDVQVDIAIDFDSSPDAPNPANSEFARRRYLCNRGERTWAEQRNYRWPELYTASTALNTTANVNTVTLPADFRFGNLVLTSSGSIIIGSAHYKLVNVAEREDYRSGEYICWITGNDASGYTLNISPTPSSVMTIYLNYYTIYLATDSGGTPKLVMTTGTDKTKVPAPKFLALFVLGQLFKDDDEGAKGVDFSNQATETLNKMLAQVNLGQQNQSGEIPDVAERAGYPAIGR